MSAMSAWIAADISPASFWESVEYWAMGSVTVGVIGEYAAEQIPKYSPWKHRTEKWSARLLILALAVELLATIRANSINNFAVGDLGNKAQQAAKLAGQLGAKVDELPSFVAQKEKEVNEQIDLFKRSASEQKKQTDAVIAELNSDREKLDKSRTEAITAAEATKNDLADMEAVLVRERQLQQQMIAAMAPRSFSPAQQAALVNRLSHFPNTTAAIWRAQTTSPDTVPFSFELVALLNKAHWQARGVSVWNNAAAVGVIIEVRKGATPAATDAANTLVDELRRDSFPSAIGQSFADELSALGSNGIAENFPNGPPPDLLIFVGTK
jgi:hypothetical protein